MKGFTLLEVLLALAIFSLIGLATVRQIQQIQNTKEAAFEDTEIYGSVRAAISMLRYDLSQAFHVLYEDLPDENKALVLQGQPAPHTLFDGRKQELIFTSLSHRVYYAGVRESEQAEISYFLQVRPNQPFPSLMKREAGLIDRNLYEGGNVFTIIDGVSSLEFKYFDDRTQKWQDAWNSDSGATRDRFPMAVQIKITVQNRSGRKVETNTKVKLAFPNNDPILAQLQ